MGMPKQGRYLGEVTVEHEGKRLTDTGCLRLETNADTHSFTLSFDFYSAEQYYFGFVAQLDHKSGHPKEVVYIHWPEHKYSQVQPDNFHCHLEQAQSHQLKLKLKAGDLLTLSGQLAWEVYYRKLTLALHVQSNLKSDFQLAKRAFSQLKYGGPEKWLERLGIETFLRPTKWIERPQTGKDSTWNEKELHELLMLQTKDEPAQPPWDWVSHGLIVEDYFERRVGTGDYSLLGMMFDRQQGSQQVEVWNGPPQQFPNQRPRQGFALFWKTIQQRVCELKNQNLFPRTLGLCLVHELLHTLNLVHSHEWQQKTKSLIGNTNFHWDTDPESSKSQIIASFFKDFDFSLHEKEHEQIRHGIHPEIAPGGSFNFKKWRSNSPYQQAQAEGRNKWAPPEKLQFTIRSKVPTYAYGQPLQVVLTLKNISDEPVPIVHLGPSHGNVAISVEREESGEAQIFFPGIIKMSCLNKPLEAGQTREHTTTLTGGNEHQWNLEPGQYRFHANLKLGWRTIPAKPSDVWTLKAKQDHFQDLYTFISTPQVSAFLGMGGGEHLNGVRDKIETLLANGLRHPIAQHFHLAIGLHYRDGQTSPLKKDALQSQPEKAQKHFESILAQKTVLFDKERLKATLKALNP